MTLLPHSSASRRARFIEALAAVCLVLSALWLGSSTADDASPSAASLEPGRPDHQ